MRPPHARLHGPVTKLEVIGAWMTADGQPDDPQHNQKRLTLEEWCGAAARMGSAFQRALRPKGERFGPQSPAISCRVSRAVAGRGYLCAVRGRYASFALLRRRYKVRK